MTTTTPAAAPAANRPHLRRVTLAGSALAVALVPLVAGVLVAKGIAADPHAPVNALIAGGGQRAGLPRAEWSRRCHTTMRRLRTGRSGAARLARPWRAPRSGARSVELAGPGDR